MNPVKMNNPESFNKELVNWEKSESVNSDASFDDEDDLRIAAMEAKLVGKKREVKKIDNKLWLTLSRWYVCIIYTLVISNFILLATAFCFNIFSYLLVNSVSWKNFHYYGLDSPLMIVTYCIVIINVSLSIGFYYFCDRYNDNGENQHLDGVVGKLNYFNKWNIIIWVIFCCFFVLFMVGLYLLGSTEGTVVLILSGAFLLATCTAILVFITLMGFYLFRRIKV